MDMNHKITKADNWDGTGSSLRYCAQEECRKCYNWNENRVTDKYPHGDLGTEHFRGRTEAAVVMLRSKFTGGSYAESLRHDVNFECHSKGSQGP